MNYSVAVSGKVVDVSMTLAALRVLSQSDMPVLAEMELFFSCLIRKRVNFRQVASPPVAGLVTGNLYLQFSPVMTQTCDIRSGGDEPRLTAFPIANEEAFVPKWLRVDYRRGEWQGEFGYD